jgi:excisionase family DNA binding protein
VIGVDIRESPTGTEPETPCLAMRAREAAKALGISERLLWEWTDRGLVPHIRLGKAKLYPVDSLREWLKQQAQTVGSNGDEKNSEK